MARSSSRTTSNPSHPGIVLGERVLPGLGLSVSQAARELGITRQTLHRILAGTTSVTPETAMRVARLSGTQPKFWLTLQQHYDLWRAEQALGNVLHAIPAYTLPRRVQSAIGARHDR